MVEELRCSAIADGYSRHTSDDSNKQKKKKSDTESKTEECFLEKKPKEEAPFACFMTLFPQAQTVICSFLRDYAQK